MLNNRDDTLIRELKARKPAKNSDEMRNASRQSFRTVLEAINLCTVYLRLSGYKLSVIEIFF